MKATNRPPSQPTLETSSFTTTFSALLWKCADVRLRCCCSWVFSGSSSSSSSFGKWMTILSQPLSATKQTMIFMQMTIKKAKTNILENVAVTLMHQNSSVRRDLLVAGDKCCVYVSTHGCRGARKFATSTKHFKTESGTRPTYVKSDYHSWMIILHLKAFL